MVGDDPLSVVYGSLWDQVTQSIAVVNLIKAGNFIKFNQPGHVSPEKHEVSSSDLPELILNVASANSSLRFNSSASKFLVRFEWWLSTGEVNLTRGLLPVLWAVFAALANWPAATSQITWRNSGTIVKLVDLIDLTSGLTDMEKNRGIRGYSAIYACEVTIVVKTQDLIDYSNGG